MIIVIEGCAGAGKSTLAYALAERLDVPVYRGFRDPRKREQRDDVSMIDSFVPVGTWREDIYAVDALAQVGASRTVIFDRSLPSALARVYEDALDDEQRSRLIQWWSTRLTGRGLLINLIAEPVVALARQRHSFSLEHIRTEQAQIEELCLTASVHGLTTVVLAGGDLEAVTEIALTAIWEAKKK